MLILECVDNEKLEVFWTLRPCVILVLLAIPSLNVLYFLEEAVNPEITFKIVGHQWYWSYEFTDFHSPWLSNKNIDSYMKNSEIMRMLETDNNVSLPYWIQIRGLLTSEDVLHSWAVPSLGIKIDACPGRINMINFMSIRRGIIYGQCSEICGVNHSFMPISIKFCSILKFINWLHS